MPAKKKRLLARPEKLVDRVTRAAVERGIGMPDLGKIVASIPDLLSSIGAENKAPTAPLPQYVDVLHALCVTALTKDMATLGRFHEIALDVLYEWEETLDCAVALPRRPERRDARLVKLMVRMAGESGERPREEVEKLARVWTEMIRRCIRGYRSYELSAEEQTAIVLGALQASRAISPEQLAAVALGALLGEHIKFPTSFKKARSLQRGKEDTARLRQRLDETAALLTQRWTAMTAAGVDDKEIARAFAAEIRHRHPKYASRPLDEAERAVLEKQQNAPRRPQARARAALHAIVPFPRRH